MDKLRAFLGRLQPGRGRRTGRVAVLPADDAFTIEASGEARRVPWVSVLQVVACKADLFAVDQICLILALQDGNLTIAEDWKGYDAFVEALPVRLPGALALAEWFPRVAFPAFEASPCVLFAKKVP